MGSVGEGGSVSGSASPSVSSAYPHRTGLSAGL